MKKIYESLRSIQQLTSTKKNKFVQMMMTAIALAFLLCFAPQIMRADVTPMVASGGYHSLALKSDGTVWAWGANSSCELGDGTKTDRSNPVQVMESPGVPMTGVTAIAAGSNHSLALKSDGTVWAWGFNLYGQLGDGSDEKISNYPVQVKNSNDSPLENVVAIAASGSHSLALKSDGTVWAWGFNNKGQLGNGSKNNSNKTMQVMEPEGKMLTDVTAIAAGGSHSLALKENGTVWAWGENLYGQLGNTSISDHTTATQVEISTESNVTAIAAGFIHSIALESDGTVWTWGSNNEKQLGYNTTVPHKSHKATKLTQLKNGPNIVISITAGTQHSLALKDDGTVWAWGYNRLGQLGNGKNINSSDPLLVQQSDGKSLIGITSITAGADHSLALKDDGTVWSWGDNNYGQSSNGIMYDSNIALQVIESDGSAWLCTADNTVTLIVRKDGAAFAAHGKTFTLQDGTNSFTGTGSDGTVSFSVPEGTYAIYNGSEPTGRTITVSDDNKSAMLDYYTVSFSVKDEGSANGSTIKATYNSSPIASNDIVLGGGILEITAIGNDADSYTYEWTGTGIIGETTASLTINPLSSKVEALCTVTGTETVKPLYNPGDIAVINAMIDNNELDWKKSDADGFSVDDSWSYSHATGGVEWSYGITDLRIVNISLPNPSLKGDVDVSGLDKLEILFFENTSLTSIVANNCPNLTHLFIRDNTSLTSLVISDCPELKEFDQVDNPSLTSLVVSDCPKLKYLNIYKQPSLTSIVIKGCTGYISCTENASLTSLVVSDCPDMTDLFIDNNTSLKLLDINGCTIPGNLWITNTSLESLDISSLNPQVLDCRDNLLTSIKLNDEANYLIIFVNNNYLANEEAVTGKNITWNGENYIFYPQNTPPAPTYYPEDIAVINTIITLNELDWELTMPVDGTYVDPSWTGVIWSGDEDETNRRIVKLFVEDQSLVGALDVSGLTNLEWLNCNNNALEAINVSGLANLEYLNCSGNLLESLEISDLENLDYLNCSDNALTSIALNENASYSYINVSENYLEDENAVTNQTIDWDEENYIFHDQKTQSEPPTPPTPPEPPTAVEPGITGPTSMTLTYGYAATSTGKYTITGTNVKVTKESGDNRISWNNATNQLDISTGIQEGVYQVILDASNDLSSATLTFTLTVERTIYSLQIPKTLKGGSVTVRKSNPNPQLESKGNTVELIITPDKGFELEKIHANKMDDKGNVLTSDIVPLRVTGNSYTFTMPAHSVAVEISFKDLRTTTGIEDMQSNSLKAYVQNGTLYVNGLTPGQTWQVYSITGTLIYKGVATVNVEASHALPLQQRGIYIVADGKTTAKVVY